MKNFVEITRVEELRIGDIVFASIDEHLDSYFNKQFVACIVCVPPSCAIGIDTWVSVMNESSVKDKWRESSKLCLGPVGKSKSCYTLKKIM